MPGDAERRVSRLSPDTCVVTCTKQPSPLNIDIRRSVKYTRHLSACVCVLYVYLYPHVCTLRIQKERRATLGAEPRRATSN